MPVCGNKEKLICVNFTKFCVWQYQRGQCKMIRFITLFFLKTFIFLCLLLAYLNFAMISKIEARRVSTVNDMLNGIEKSRDLKR